MKLIVGLGNPGRQYVGTRHNVGFEVVDRFAQRMGLVAQAGDFERLGRMNFQGLMMDGLMTLPSGWTEKVILLKPATYMNLSGQSVQPAMAFYQLTPRDLMVVLDDMALPMGRIRLRSGGSSGGHNGLKDIERALGTNRYPRLRVGIDAPPQRVPGRDYVLGRLSEEQRTVLDPALTRAVEALDRWIEKGIDAAMSEFNAADEKDER